MTDPSPLRSRAPIPGTSASGTPARSRRRLAGLAAAGVISAALSPAFAAAPAVAAPVPAAPVPAAPVPGAPVPGAPGPAAPAPAGPAAAHPSSPCQSSFGATAAADLLTVQAMNPAALGLTMPSISDLTVSSTRAGVAGGAHPRAAALATYLAAKLLGKNVPAAVLTTRAEQHAPPSNAKPAVVPTVGVDLAAARLGTGELTAHATLDDHHRCDATTGPTSTAGSRLTQARLLPASAGRSLADLSAMSTSTAANLTRSGDRYVATATATASVSGLTVFAGSGAAVAVHVLSQPTLRVVAGGSKERSSVAYAAPVLEVSVPGAGTRRIEGPGGHVDLAVPLDGASASAAQAVGRTEGMPVLGGNPLGTLLTGLGGAVPGAVGAARSAAGSAAGSAVGSAAAARGGSGAAAGTASADASGSGRTEAGTSDAGALTLPGLDGIPGIPALGSSLDQLSGLLGGGTPPAGAARTDGDAQGGTTPGSTTQRSTTQRSTTQRSTTPGSTTPGSNADPTATSTNAARPAEGADHGYAPSTRAPRPRVAVIRISLGELSKEITDAGVHAKAASVRLQVIVRSCGCKGYGGAGDQADTVADLAVGVLDAAAAAPLGGIYGGTGGGGSESTGTGGGTGSTTGHGTGGTQAAASLPVTGGRMGLMAGAGTVLVICGRFLMLLARRRATV